ncbi:MAG: hypothetical protein WD557_18575 [Dehalococcoidia bacterium]
MALACGDDDDNDDATQPAASDCAEDTAATPATPTDASKLLPSLTDLCLGMTASGRDPAELAGMQSALALYNDASNPKEQVQLRVYVMPSPQLARAQFDAFAEALRNPPPEFVGVEAKFVDAASPQLGESRKSYMTESPDSGGYSAWSDVYLKGRTVVLVQVVDVSEDGQPTRTQAAERALSEAP